MQKPLPSTRSSNLLSYWNSTFLISLHCFLYMSIYNFFPLFNARTTEIFGKRASILPLQAENTAQLFTFTKNVFNSHFVTYVLFSKNLWKTSSTGNTWFLLNVCHCSYYKNTTRAGTVVTHALQQYFHFCANCSYQLFKHQFSYLRPSPNILCHCSFQLPIKHKFLYLGPNGNSFFIFSNAGAGNFQQIYLKHSPSSHNTFTRHFSESGFICSGDHSTLCQQNFQRWYYTPSVVTAPLSNADMMLCHPIYSAKHRLSG